MPQLQVSQQILGVDLCGGKTREMPPLKGRNGSYLGKGDNSEIGTGVEPMGNKREEVVQHHYIIAMN